MLDKVGICDNFMYIGWKLLKLWRHLGKERGKNNTREMMKLGKPLGKLQSQNDTLFKQIFLTIVDLQYCVSFRFIASCFFFIIGCCRILNIVQCAIEYIHVACLFCI